LAPASFPAHSVLLRPLAQAENEYRPLSKQENWPTIRTKPREHRHLPVLPRWHSPWLLLARFSFGLLPTFLPSALARGVERPSSKKSSAWRLSVSPAMAVI